MTGTIPTLRTAERTIRVALLAVFTEGLRRRSLPAIANAVSALVATVLPDVLERRYDVEFRPWQRAYLGTAMLAHALGMLGPYDEVSWWDSITHTLSASLLGGFVYVVARRRDRRARPRVVATVVGLGVLWELLEYGIHAVADRLGVEPILVPYSARDTAGDLLFNVVGAVLVLVFGDRLLENFVDGSS